MGIMTADAIYTITGDYAANSNAKLLDFVAKHVEVTGDRDREGRPEDDRRHVDQAQPTDDKNRWSRSCQSPVRTGGRGPEIGDSNKKALSGSPAGPFHFRGV